MGAWIEIEDGESCGLSCFVAPYMGAWIEIHRPLLNASYIYVAPYMGAWIEIIFCSANIGIPASLPTWERGLKYRSHNK